MKRNALFMILTLALIGTPTIAQSANDTKEVATQLAMRDLWVDHIFWVRSVVTARAAKDKKAEASAEKQVVANAKKLAGAIEPFYGKAATEKLFGLLAGHYGAIKEYLDASIPRVKQSAQSTASKNLTANAMEIATFLSAANPNLPKGTLVGLLSAHGGHHIAQIGQIQKKDYDAEAATWEAMKGHMYVIADALTAAIAKQFPDKF